MNDDCLNKQDSSPMKKVPIYLPRLLIALSCQLIYLITMPKSITLEDAGMFQMICHLGGLAHPPGYPLFTLLCQPLVQLPLPPVMAGNLVSALFASLTALILFEIAQHYFKQTCYALLFSLGYAYSLAFWSQAIIIEVYTLNTLMFALCWLLVLKLCQTRDLRYFYTLSLCYGLSLSNHWPLMVLSTPALVAMATPALPLLFSKMKSARFWIWSISLFVLGLAPYLTLLQNSPQFAVHGGIESVEEFFDYITRANYDDNHLTAEITDKFRYFGWLLLQSMMQFGLLGIPFLLIGIVDCFRRFDIYTNIGLWLLYSGNTLVLALLIGFDFDAVWQATFKPYPLLSYMALALWMTCGFRSIAERLRKHVKWLPLIGSSFLVIAILVSNLKYNNRSNSFLPDLYGRTILKNLDQYAVLFVNGDVDTGVLGYLHHVEKLRADIQLYNSEGMVFGNRLGSPYESRKNRTTKNMDYIVNTHLSVYSVSSLFFHPYINYGIFYKYNPQGYGLKHILATNEFFNLVLETEASHTIKSAHEIELVDYLIQRLAYHHIKLTSRNAGSIDSSRKKMRLIEDTFAGKLGIINGALDDYPSIKSKAELLSLAVDAEKSVPEGLRASQFSLLYYYIGSIFLLEDVNSPRDTETAILYLEKSIKNNPSRENKSVCLLHEIYLAEGKGDLADTLSCPSEGG